MQVGADGKLQHFGALLIDDNGGSKSVIKPATQRVKRCDRLIDGAGQDALPGFIDAHGHVMELGFAALQLDLVGTSSLAELQQRLRAYAAAHPDDSGSIGFGWNQELWPDKTFPTAADLDAVVGDRPVVLERVDGHALRREQRGDEGGRRHCRTRRRRRAGASRTACSSTTRGS